MTDRNETEPLEYVWIVRYSPANLIAAICTSEKNARRAARDGERITKAKINHMEKQ